MNRTRRGRIRKRGTKAVAVEALSAFLLFLPFAGCGGRATEEASTPLFEDGFEEGSASSWSQEDNGEASEDEEEEGEGAGES